MHVPDVPTRQNLLPKTTSDVDGRNKIFSRYSICLQIEKINKQNTHIIIKLIHFSLR